VAPASELVGAAQVLGQQLRGALALAGRQRGRDLPVLVDEAPDP